MWLAKRNGINSVLNERPEMTPPLARHSLGEGGKTRNQRRPKREKEIKL
jgi:hypothetical protein